MGEVPLYGSKRPGSLLTITCREEIEEALWIVEGGVTQATKQSSMSDLFQPAV
jgi:hypothetical protein